MYKSISTVSNYVSLIARMLKELSNQILFRGKIFRGKRLLFSLFITLINFVIVPGMLYGQCDPNNDAPPYCAPQPICPSGNHFLWSQPVNQTDGSVQVRLVCWGDDSAPLPNVRKTYTIPGPYPAAFNGAVNVNVSDAVSYDGYSGRNQITQSNERWRVLFRKNGSTVYATPYTNDVADFRNQAYWRGALGTTTLLPNGTDQIVIEHWSIANGGGCTPGNEHNSIAPASVCISFSAPCDNVTNGGQIGSNQSSCLAIYDPAMLTNNSAPSGGTGTLQYLWLRSTTTCIAPNGTNNSEWQEIPNSNAAYYDPGPIYQNICYVRRARRAGCTDYTGISNVVSVTVSGPAVQIGSALTLVKDRVISNELHCINSRQRVLWMDCLLDNSPGGTSEDAKWWKIISGGTFREYCDGTAYFEMSVQNLAITTHELDIKIVLSGRTYSAPPGSPHLEGCTSSATSDWYYYTNVTGTITGVNGLSGALLSIDRKEASFQVGTNASLYAGPGQFGASAGLMYNVINHPTNFKLKTECGADLNFLLSGGALTSAQASTCSSICVGANTQLTANGAGGRPGYTYAWDNNLGSGQTKTVIPASTTTYKVTITDTNGCTSTSQTTIFVNPQPVLDAGQNVEICQGQSVLLTVNATNGTSPYTYTWPNPPGGTGTSKSVSPMVTTTYVITVTDSKGCSDTDDIAVNITPNPGITTDAPPVCTGSTLSITSSPSGGTPGYTYSWSGPSGFTATTQNISRPGSTTAMSGTYSVTVTDSKGCVAVSTLHALIESKAKVGDFVWEDNNGNGRQDTGEIGLNGINVFLIYAANNVLAASTVTGSRNGQPGYYEFEECKGTYYIVFGDYSGYARTVKNAPNTNVSNDSDANPNTGRSDIFTLHPGDNNLTIDAGYKCFKVGDFVWIDFGSVPNVQDAGDVGINNVEVRLYQAFTNILIATEFTRNSPVDGRAGYYLFECVPPGTYYIKLIKPNPNGSIIRYDFVQPNQGANDLVDSDIVDFLNGNTLSFTVGYYAQTILDIDIGMISVLPVQIKDLSGWWNKTKDVNELIWITSEEFNNSHFIIDRSFEEGRYEYVGKLEGKGISTTEVTYNFVDSDITSEGNYSYRITQVDFDGETSYIGEVNIKVSRETGSDIFIYPNPSKDDVNIIVNYQSEKETVVFELYDALGRVVLEEQAFDDISDRGAYKLLALNGYNQGIYYLKVKAGTQQKVFRLIKVE